MSFSQKKFCSFSQEKQRKKLFALLQKIEDKWKDSTSREKMVEEYQPLAALVGAEFTQIDFSSKRNFLLKMTELENLHQINKSDWQILSKDNEARANAIGKIPLVLILDNLRSAFNVGAILRTAECFNIQKILFCGVTPNLENRKVLKTSMGCGQRLEALCYDDTKQAIEDCQKAGYAVFALETTTRSQPLSSVKFEQPTALVLGNEALGIEQNTLLLCDGIYQIELQGWKNSLNVGICCGIALYELSQKRGNR